jgi:hypothetical protein
MFPKLVVATTCVVDPKTTPTALVNGGGTTWLILVRFPAGKLGRVTCCMDGVTVMEVELLLLMEIEDVEGLISTKEVAEVGALLTSNGITVGASVDASRAADRRRWASKGIMVVVWNIVLEFAEKVVGIWRREEMKVKLVKEKEPWVQWVCF